MIVSPVFSRMSYRNLFHIILADSVFDPSLPKEPGVNAIFDAWSDYIGCSIRQSSHASGSLALTDFSRFSPITAKKRKKKRKKRKKYTEWFTTGKVIDFFLSSRLMLSESEVFTNQLSVWTAKWPKVQITSNLWTDFCSPNSRQHNNIHISGTSRLKLCRFFKALCELR